MMDSLFTSPKFVHDHHSELATKAFAVGLVVQVPCISHHEFEVAIVVD
jgi:hypothetical protein